MIDRPSDNPNQRCLSAPVQQARCVVDPVVLPTRELQRFHERVLDMSEPNPCLECGICCTHFRISFYWAEGDDAPGGFVPAHMTEKLNEHMRCMKGSNSVPRRCSALAGEPGTHVMCTIYENRPTPCREFPVYFDDGMPNPKCDELRATIGLPPLPVFDLPRAA